MNSLIPLQMSVHLLHQLFCWEPSNTYYVQIMLHGIKIRYLTVVFKHLTSEKYRRKQDPDSINESMLLTEVHFTDMRIWRIQKTN